MADVALKYVLSQYIREQLFTKLSTEITEEDGTKVGLVKVGRLQDDPTVFMKNVMVRPNKDKPDAVHTHQENKYDAPAYLIGGGYHAHWWRRFIAEFQLFYDPDVSRDEAYERSEIILARARNVLSTMPLPVFQVEGVDSQTDTFGESPIEFTVTHMLTKENGGPGSFIWRCEIGVEVLTEVQTD